MQGSITRGYPQITGPNHIRWSKDQLKWHFSWCVHRFSVGSVLLCSPLPVSIVVTSGTARFHFQIKLVLSQYASRFEKGQNLHVPPFTAEKTNKHNGNCFLDTQPLQVLHGCMFCHSIVCRILCVKVERCKWTLYLQCTTTVLFFCLKTIVNIWIQRINCTDLCASVEELIF